MKNADVRINFNQSPFYLTRNIFRDSVSYIEPLSFDEWMEIPEDKKAAVLFVQFFEQITLAWNKCKSFYTEEEEGISTVLQYLVKNVPIIEANPKRFTPNYIYRVAYNCMYCICHDYLKDKRRWENECSNIISYGDSELDLFDTISYDCVEESEDTFFQSSSRSEFWSIIENVDIETSEIVGTCKKLFEDVPNRKLKFEHEGFTEAERLQVIDELCGGHSVKRRKKISDEKRSLIIETLRDELKDFRYLIVDDK